jgi:hypothetical protein
MLPGGFQQTLFAKFLSLIIQCFSNTIGVKQDGVAGGQFAFLQWRNPISRTSQVGPSRSTVSSSRKSKAGGWPQFE